MPDYQVEVLLKLENHEIVLMPLSETSLRALNFLQEVGDSLYILAEFTEGTLGVVLLQQPMDSVALHQVLASLLFYTTQHSCTPLWGQFALLLVLAVDGVLEHIQSAPQFIQHR